MRTRFYAVLAAITVLSFAGWGSGQQAASDRFIDNKDGTITDVTTGLMWAAKDNGVDIMWDDAKKFCESSRVGGHADWRMPTVEELRKLYDRSSMLQPQCQDDVQMYITPLIPLSCMCVWSSELKDQSLARDFNFVLGTDTAYIPSFTKFKRALPVRTR